MRIVKLTPESKNNILENLLKRSPNNYSQYESTVNQIIEKVRAEGDNALFDYTLQFDKFALSAVKQLALLTLYVDYQMRVPEERAEDIYLYFSHYAFHDLHIEDMFHAGRENLTETEQFWNDWISLLKTKSGDTESRLLKDHSMPPFSP